MAETKKLILCAGGPLLSSGGKPMYLDRMHAQKLAEKLAARVVPRGFWHGAIFEAEGYIRLNFGGQPYEK